MQLGTGRKEKERKSQRVKGGKREGEQPKKKHDENETTMKGGAKRVKKWDGMRSQIRARRR